MLNNDFTPLEILQKYWKHANFRGEQKIIIDSVLAKNDVLTLLPTGAGKSVCYQIPALVQKGVCIVISPLIALMQDQVNSLKKKGIKAISITSKLSENDIVIAFDNMQFGNIKLVYLSPEKLQSDFILTKLRQLTINLIAVDEAHCISEWGNDFRPSYLKIAILRELFPKVNIIALTATATPIVAKDIIKNLELKNEVVFKQTFKRENLAYQVFKTEDINFKVQQILTKIKKPCIIYVNSRRQTKELANFLNKKGFKSAFYNGGMSVKDKEIAFNNWLSEKTRIIVATNAFGMGIDKDNVAIVIHVNLPNSIENYIQEAGRAGRNGKKAFAVILYNDNTVYNFSEQTSKNIVPIAYLKKIYLLLNQHLQIALGEQNIFKYLFDLQEFTTKYKLEYLKTYNSILLLEKEGILEYEQNYYSKSKIQFITQHKRVLAYIASQPKHKAIIQLLLRSYGGVFENKTEINEFTLARKLNYNKLKIISLLKEVAENGIINYELKASKSYLLFLVMREDSKTINNISRNVIQRNKLKQQKSEAVINYVNNHTICRSIQLLSYFKETNLNECGICEICLKSQHTTTNLEEISKNILRHIKIKKALNSKEIVILLAYNENNILKVLQLLLEKNILKLNSENKYEQR